MTSPYRSFRTAYLASDTGHWTLLYRCSTVTGVDLTRDVSLEPDLARGIVGLLDGWSIWAAFTVAWDDPALPGLVSMDVAVDAGRPRVERLTVTARGTEAVDGQVLRRVPVGTLLEYAIAYAVMAEDEPGRPRLFKTPADFAAFRALRPRHRERVRWQLTPELLEEVARVYRQATSAPVQEVARHFNKPRATASRWIAKARAEGYFDAPKKRTRTTTKKGTR